MHDSNPHHRSECGETGDKNRSCAPVPQFRRLKYFYGQMLGAQDFQAEQAYFREKMKLHNRCLHGYGVVCGLLVAPAPVQVPCGTGERSDRAAVEERMKVLKANLKAAEEKKDEKGAAGHREEIDRLSCCLKKLPEVPGPDDCSAVVIECGVALDCEGNELVLRDPITVDLWRSLTPDERKKADCEKGETLYLSLCFCEQPVDPVRPVLTDACGAVSGCLYGKVQDSVRIKVSTARPARDRRCDTCCEPCAEPCLLLAKIRHFKKGVPVEEWQIHNEVRRRIGLYHPVTVVGISWTHGATYTVEDANEIIGTENEHGIKVVFSRPVLKSTLRRGVVEMWVLEGGRGLSGAIIHKSGKLEYEESGETTTWFTYRQTTEEAVNGGDRVMIIIRTEFILDECCRPVDGAHVGGRVPILEEYKRFEHCHDEHDCVIPPWGYGPWTSGNGSPGSNFVSWFFVQRHEKHEKHHHHPYHSHNSESSHEYAK